MSGLIATEGFIQLPPDSTGKQLRAFPIAVNVAQGDGTFVTQTEYQQVFVPVDAQGNQIGVDGGMPLNIRSRSQEALLEGILEALTTLIALYKEDR
jgi:hypothetical protein